MTKDLTVGKPDKVLWKFCLPLFGSIIFQQLYNIADSFVAGKFVGEDALAAVGYAYCGQICRDGCSCGSWKQLRNHFDIHSLCVRLQYRVFGDCIPAFRCKMFEGYENGCLYHLDLWRCSVSCAYDWRACLF